jgi:hypothetical protein
MLAGESRKNGLEPVFSASLVSDHARHFVPGVPPVPP